MIKFSEMIFQRQKHLLYEKVCDALQNYAEKKGLIMFFVYKGKHYAANEEERINFTNIMNPKKEIVKIDEFEAIELDSLVNGKLIKKIIDKKNKKDVNVVGLEKICKMLQNKYKIFSIPK